MKPQNYFCIVLFFCASTVFAQENYSFQFGKLTQHEVEMTKYELDSTAEAVVVYEMGKYYFLGDDASGRFKLRMDKQLKIKILKQAGLKYADIEIPYYESGNEFETVKVNEATTYNYENNQLIRSKLDTKNIFNEKTDENWHRAKFSMPNVKEGSIIEIDYSIVSPFLFNLHDWEFQHDIPVVSSNLELRIIPYYEYVYIMRGASKFDEYSQEAMTNEIRWGNLLYREMQIKMGRKNIPAFRDEEFITSPNDYKNMIQFQLSVIHYPRGGENKIMSTWPALANDFLKDELFGKYIEAAEKASKKIVPTLNLDGKTDAEKIQIITEYVKANYNWNGTITKFAREKAAKIITNKTGNSAELNLLLLALLRQAGIAAKPLVLSTRGHGQIPTNYPFQQFFNYVIVLVENGDDKISLDATEPMLAFNELPTRCINVKGLIIEKNSDKWVEIEQNELSHTEKEFSIGFTEDRSVQKTHVNYTAFSYDAFKYRKIYYGETQRLKEYLEKQSITSPTNINVKNYDDSEQPFMFSFDTESQANTATDKLFISPFLKLAPQDNIFKQNERTLPVDMILRDGGSYKATIEIPAGYKVEYLPKTLNHEGLIIDLHYKAEQHGNSVIVEADYAFKKSMYEAKLYAALKFSYNDVIKKLNEMIVLAKE